MRRLLLALLVALPLFAQTPRLASDFEIAQMEKQLAASRGFEAQLSGRLNLGDVRAARNELTIARAEYERALALAEAERRDARVDSHLARYAAATSYAGLAAAKLGRASQSMSLLEEALRYAGDDPESWSLYASAMRILGKPEKGASAARNAVAVADPEKKLDFAIYRHALATALIENGEEREAEEILAALTASLRSIEFEPLQRKAAQLEAFEVYSSARGDVAAYVSLLNRAQLRLAALYEKRGALDKARAEYERVRAGRSDDATALAALARLATSDAERDRLYREAFEANPLSMPLVRQYREHLRTDPRTSGGTPMQRALQQLARGETRAARETLDALLAKFPASETLRALRREAEGSAIVSLPPASPAAAELRALLEGFERLAPEQRTALDALTLASVVDLDGGTGSTFESGSIGDVPFRFAQPATFAGTFAPHARLTYRILGVTRSGDRDALLLEPLRLEALP